MLKKQQGAFATLDQWIRQEQSVPRPVREQWRRLCKLQQSLKSDCFQELAGKLSPAETPVPDPTTARFTGDLFRFLEAGFPSLQALADYLTRAIHADRGIVIACSERSSQVRILAASNLQEPNLTTDEFQVSRTVFRQVLRFRHSVLIRNPLDDPDYGAQSSIVSSRIQSVLAVPVLARSEVTAILYFDTVQLHRTLSEIEMTCLEQVRPLVKSLFFAQPLEPKETAAGGELFLNNASALQGLIGRSAEFLDAVALLRKVAPTPATILLEGESGTGKELFARAAHVLSPRKGGPFVAINCAAIPDTLLESELFGHEKAAFTGADARRIGKVEQANHGLLFLDEIGELKPELQAKLLRFLQFHQIERVGGGAPVPVDVRVVAATNQNLAAKVKEGVFRQDLYFRLNVFPIVLPPLRRRRSDIRPLAEHFFQKYAQLLNLRRLDIHPGVFAALENHDFPGNVRELENLVYRALLLSKGGRVEADALPSELRADSSRDMEKNPYGHLLKDLPASYEELSRRKEEMKRICRDEIAVLERRFAEALVSASGGNISKAAAAAGIDRSLFYRLLKPDE